MPQDHVGTTALILASQNGHPAVVRVLIGKGAKVDGMNKVRPMLLYDHHNCSIDRMVCSVLRVCGAFCRTVV